MSAAMENVMQMAEGQAEALLEWASPEQTETFTAGWLLGPTRHAIVCAALYLAFVFVATPIMKLAPKPILNLAEGFVKRVSPMYNFAQVVLCSYMCLRALELARDRGFSVVCSEFDQKREDLATLLHLFYLSKMLDFADTVFIILRRKWRQLSVLHVYHHTSIFLVFWMNLRVGYDGDVWFTIAFNSFVHLVMYQYYFMSPWFAAANFRPWFKPLITLLQIIQFLCMNAQAIYALYRGDCAYPANIIWFYLFYVLSFVVLFSNFAIVNYCTKSKKTKSKKPKKQ